MNTDLNQALAMLDHAASLAPLPRHQHAQLQQAAQAISSALERLAKLEAQKLPEEAAKA